MNEFLMIGDNVDPGDLDIVRRELRSRLKSMLADLDSREGEPEFVPLHQREISCFAHRYLLQEEEHIRLDTKVCIDFTTEIAAKVSPFMRLLAESSQFTRTELMFLISSFGAFAAVPALIIQQRFVAAANLVQFCSVENILTTAC